jgi:hypothetical protein
VFAVRYELDLYISFRRNLDCQSLNGLVSPSCVRRDIEVSKIQV